MNTRLVQVVVPEALSDRVCETLEERDKVNWWRTDILQDDRVDINILAKPGEAQEIMDRVDEVLEGEDNWRMVLLPVEAVSPEILTEDEAEELRRSSISASRQEIFDNVRADATLTPDFLVMVALSTVVAAIGLNSDQVAAVIGAMVIAPLLGPLMGLALGIALGARHLIGASLVSAGAGFGVAVLASGAMALVLPLNTDSSLLQYSQPVTLGVLVLALASGAAAALAVSNAQSSALVGVMVAAAVLPPVAASGLLLSGGEIQQSARAAFIVLANVLCIALAAQVVFIVKGVRPRRWTNLREAETSSRTNLAVLGVALALLAALVLLTDIV